MSPTDLPDMTVEELIELFATIGLDEDEAILDDDNERFTGLFWEMEAVEAELKSREGDQRRALMHLYEHPNAQVRLCAAKATLSVTPEEARALLRKLRQSREFPQAGDAGMTLWALEEGIFKPS
jgi:hypothetical protein